MIHNISKKLDIVSRLSVPLRGPIGPDNLGPCFNTKDELDQVRDLSSRFESEGVNAKELRFFYENLYAFGCLTKLWELHLALNEAKSGEHKSKCHENTVLGIKDQKVILTLVQIIFSWIVLPQLEVDVVNHLQGEINTASAQDEHVGCTYSPAVLSASVVTLNAMIDSDWYLPNKIRAQYLPIVLASLFQLKGCSTPKVRAYKLPPIEDILRIFNPPESLILPLGNKTFDCIHIDYSEEAEKLLESSNIQNSIRVLMSLVRIKSVKWVTSQSSQYLTSMVLKKNGLVGLMHALLPSDKSELGTNQINALSALVATTPMLVSQEEYYSNISRQLCAILEKLDEDRLEYAVSISIIAKICSRSPHIGYYKVLHPLIDRLTLIDAPQSVVSKYITNSNDIHGRPIIATHEYMNTILKILSNLTENISLLPGLASLLLKIVPQAYCIYEAETSWSNSSQAARWLGILTSIIENCKSEDVCLVLKFLIVDIRKTAATEVSLDDDRNIQIVLKETVGGYILDTSLFSKFITSSPLGNLAGDIFLYILELINSTWDCLYDDKIIMIDIILHLLEDGSGEILKNPVQVLEFAKKTIFMNDEKMISLGVGLIYAVLVSGTLKPDSKSSLSSILTMLDSVAAERRSDILTNASKELIDLINSSAVMNSEEPKPQPVDTLEESLKELQHELLPVRAQAMFKIKNLVDRKEDSIFLRLESIFASVMPQLSHEDSFLYLNAVKLLSSMTVNYPHIYLNRVINSYLDQDNPTEIRLRIAEVIIQTINIFNQIFPVYSDIYIYGILKNLRDKDPRILASTLSLISVVAEKQPLSLSHYIYTILESVKSIIVFETDNDVRRGATAILSNLLVYVEKFALNNDNILILRQIYILLKRIALEDKDDVVRATCRSFISHMHQSIL